MTVFRPPARIAPQDRPGAANVQMGPVLLPTPLHRLRSPALRLRRGYGARRSRRHPVPSGGEFGPKAALPPGGSAAGTCARASTGWGCEHPFPSTQAGTPALPTALPSQPFGSRSASVPNLRRVLSRCARFQDRAAVAVVSPAVPKFPIPFRLLPLNFRGTNPRFRCLDAASGRRVAQAAQARLFHFPPIQRWTWVDNSTLRRRRRNIIAHCACRAA